MKTVANSPAPKQQAAARPLARQVGRQGALLLSGFALAQICSFGRNALVGYWLSRGDFGVAATITIALQMLETLSDLGADRLLVQAEDGDAPALMAAAHATLLLRGLLTSIILFLSAGVVTTFFAISGAERAFQLAALVPLIKSFMHLDSRRLQRSLQNRTYLLIEVVPQLVALMATVPLLYIAHDYSAVVWIALLQAVLSVIASHLLSRRRYELGLEPAFVKRLLAFGWPIWLSAFPLVFVYQGDRIIVGRLLGVEALASYSAAFMVAMVPGILAAKVGHALMLPLLSAQRDNPEVFFQRYMKMLEAVSIAAAGYLVGFVIGGSALVRLAFGPYYADLGPVLGLLAAMWSLRMVQAVPGMALMALGDTRPLLTAGLIRAAALGPAFAAVSLGFGLEGVAAAGVLGEFASLIYVVFRTTRGVPGLPWPCIARTMYPVAAGLIAVVSIPLLGETPNAWTQIPIGALMAAIAMAVGAVVMPISRRYVGQMSGFSSADSAPTASDNPTRPNSENAYAIPHA